MSKKHKKNCGFLKHLLNLVSTVTVCLSVSAFASLVGIRIGIKSSATGLESFAITAGIKKYKSIIKKKKKKHDIVNVVLLAKSKLNYIEVFN